MVLCPTSYALGVQPKYPVAALHETVTEVTPAVAVTTGVDTNGYGRNPGLIKNEDEVDNPRAHKSSVLDI